jgi:hypothetical protein
MRHMLLQMESCIFQGLVAFLESTVLDVLDVGDDAACHPARGISQRHATDLGQTPSPQNRGKPPVLPNQGRVMEQVQGRK